MNVETWRRNNDRPKWVQANRREIEAETGKLPPYRLRDLPEWLDDNKAAVTEEMKADGGDDEDDGGDEEAAQESEDDNEENDNE